MKHDQRSTITGGTGIRLFGVPIAEQNAELIAISRITCTSLQETTTPKAESARPRLSQWLNRTLRSIVPNNPESTCSHPVPIEKAMDLFQTRCQTLGQAQKCSAKRLLSLRKSFNARNLILELSKMGPNVADVPLQKLLSDQTI